MYHLYGYRRCSTCRNAQAFLERLGVDVSFHDIVESPPDVPTLRRWLEAAHGEIKALVNTRGEVYRKRGLKEVAWPVDTWLEELHRDGKLIRRPVLETPSGRVIVGFDEAAYRDAVSTEQAP
ncbi:Spx/MgsR family RNA polymerase-binding regulatory protein [Alicyclobacillus mali]|uniref:Spx/MgsR family RNA polymerase-binding regulatory protein n=1 Tax=Alicyclobacillus mali (ex Roth et al. 2021) TaxID=1123961 RepID=A0ABS0F176_9BACL|nr:Spx/MgsR family RNA polymerase-binding regulatory protein [Alicyclobacillus mali (ex Roth et al. 2021)]MCL6488370.1 Spx/MgsR family RNA polymerase-binding regulatory protein [Alicyclobacillus mali (ex Roth et al. 2021)]